MADMASWGPMVFTISPRKITALEGLTTSLTLKEDSENDTSGTEPTNTRGRELRPISFKVPYLAAAGVDPRQELEKWEAQLGKFYPLIVGGRVFGAEKMKLTKVDASDILLTNSGGFIRVTVGVTLEEYSDGKTSKLVSTGGTGGTGAGKTGGGTSKGPNPYERGIVLQTTASAADKEEKKPSTAQAVDDMWARHS